MSPTAKHSPQALGLCADAASLREALGMFEEVLTTKADRARVAKHLEKTACVLLLAAARLRKSPKAAEVLRTLQSKHPGTNHN